MQVEVERGLSFDEAHSKLTEDMCPEEGFYTSKRVSSMCGPLCQPHLEFSLKFKFPPVALQGCPVFISLQHGLLKQPFSAVWCHLCAITGCCLCMWHVGQCSYRAQKSQFMTSIWPCSKDATQRRLVTKRLRHHSPQALVYMHPRNPSQPTELAKPMENDDFFFVTMDATCCMDKFVQYIIVILSLC